MDARQKAKDLMALALDERTPEKERISAAFNALKIIQKNGLLESPLDGIMNSDNETVQAVGTIFDKLFNDREFTKSVKKVAGGLRRRR